MTAAPDSSPRDLLTESAAARVLAISAKTLKRMREAGLVPFVPIQGEIMTGWQQ